MQRPLVMGYRKGKLPVTPGFPAIERLPAGVGVTIEEIKRLIGGPVGLNLEPVPAERMSDEFAGRAATLVNAGRAVQLGVDYLVLTGNPGTGVSTQPIAQAARGIAAAVGERASIMAIRGRRRTYRRVAASIQR